MIVIPARLNSTRLPNKVLADINGKPMIQHVWENASQASETFVATDSKKIKKIVEGFGGKVILTGRAENGTARIYQATKGMPATELIANLQADEPMIKADLIKRCIMGFKEVEKPKFLDPSGSKASQGCDMLSAYENCSKKDAKVKSIVKVKIKDGYAAEFSRKPISNYKHLGIYLYTVGTLGKYIGLENDGLDLEQTRALKAGWKIKMVKSNSHTIAVDILEDLEGVRERLK